MKKTIKTIMAGIIILGSVATMLHAQSPGWSVNPADYQYSMTLTTFLTVNGQTLTGNQDKVAAFINGEVRGVASVIYASGANRYLAYLTVYANASGEPVSFKIYDSTNNAVVDVSRQIDFSIDAQFGNAFQAFSLASPALNSEARLIDFGFAETPVLTLTIATGLVSITVDNDADIRALIPEFTLSEGARLFYEGAIQLPGESMLDFSDTVVFTVLSADEENLVTYQVVVTNVQAGTEKDFVSTNVLTPNNDGQNDYWIVQDAYKYSQYNFRIYDVNGRTIYESTGYANNWDGYYKGNRLDPGKYYYVVSNPAVNVTIQGDILIIY